MASLSLYVRACRDLDHVPAAAIVDALSVSPEDGATEHPITLSNAALSSSDVAALAHALRLCAPTTLDLSGNEIDADAAGDVAEALVSLRAAAPGHRRRRVKTISLARNPGMGDAGAAIIATRLLCNAACAASLESLDLSECDIGDAGCVRLADALAADVGLSSRRLSALRLNGNAIGDAGADAIACALCGAGASTVPLHLAELSLSDNAIGDEGASAIARAISSGRCRSLQTLELAMNRITGMGVDALLEAVFAPSGGGADGALAAGTGMRHLDVSGSPLTLLGAGLVAAALQQQQQQHNAEEGTAATRVVDLLLGDAACDAAQSTVAEAIERATSAVASGAVMRVALGRIHLGEQTRKGGAPAARSTARTFQEQALALAQVSPILLAEQALALAQDSPSLLALAAAVTPAQQEQQHPRLCRLSSPAGPAAEAPTATAIDPLANLMKLLSAGETPLASSALLGALKPLGQQLRGLENQVEALRRERDVERQRSQALELRMEVRRRSSLGPPSLSLSLSPSLLTPPPATLSPLSQTPIGARAYCNEKRGRQRDRLNSGNRAQACDTSKAGGTHDGACRKTNVEDRGRCDG